jgi:molecular chaperone HtpG
MTEGSRKQTLGFQSEIKQLLDLMIHSLYSNPEIFLRELISNGADAADKLKFLALSNEALYEGDGDLKITVEFDAQQNTITVRDNGIGMSRDEIVDNLGTIARSGTKAFFSELTGDVQKDSQLIGQFGVGFYSSFIVADSVTVTSRKAGLPAAEGVRWESDGAGEYTVETVEVSKRGTEVKLHLRGSAKEFADAWRLRQIIKKFSDHISIPIQMLKEGDKKKKPEWETVNTATALWTRNKKDISEGEYREFYKHISHDFEEPLAWAHNQVEGKLEYTTLLYIPKRAPFDLWDRETRHGVKLYVQRVFIMENAEELLPRYLRFVRGVIDTRDLPLNISREILQHNKAVDSIRQASVKRVLGLIEQLAEGKDYADFWRPFGRVLKEGIIEDSANRERIARLLRFSSTHEEKPEPDVSLKDYVGRMQKDQDGIYYVTAESFLTAKNSPHLEAFRAKGIEVLLLWEPVDEWLVTHLTEFDGKALKAVTRATLDLDKQEAKDQAAEPDKPSKELTERIAKALGERVKDVRISRRLTSSPACLVSDDYAMSANLERILKAAGQSVPASKRILEINPEHPIIQRLAAESDEAQIKRWSEIVFDQAVLAEGGRLEDPAGFVKRLNDVLAELTRAA